MKIIKRLFSTRTAMLLVVLLTATTAWAELDPVTVGEYTFSTDSDDNGEYYVIDSNNAFEKLATYVSGGGDTTDKRFKMTSNFSVSATMVGTYDNPFKGTFDGGGYKLTIRHELSNTYYCAPFRYVNGATIKNLRVDGIICTKGQYSGGVIGRVAGGTVNIENCKIETAIYSARAGKCYHGGVVGSVASGAIVFIRGCVFTGCLATSTQSNQKSTECGGFVGNNSGTARIKNCLFKPSHPSRIQGNKCTAITTGNTFGGNLIFNSYYTEKLGTAQGNQCYSILADENVTVDFSGDDNGTFNLSGITAYKNGLKYGNRLYSGPSQKVSLSLGHSNPEGTAFLGYSVSSGSLSYSDGSYELKMPKSDVTVSGEWRVFDLSLFGAADGADGTEEHPYIITSTEELERLATLVNSGMAFNGQHFKLGADIAYDKNTENNHTSIGNSDYYFQGTFDGNGHVVSGININRPSDYCQALFGSVKNGAIRNIIVSDATIIGNAYVGAVVGFAGSSYTIENCYYRNVTFGGYRNYESYRVHALQTLTLGDNVGTTTPKTLTLGGTDYYVVGTTVTLSCGLEPKGYKVNGKLIDGNKFNIPAEDVTVEAQYDIDLASYWGTGSGSTAATPYVISNVEGLNLLAMMTRSGETFANTFFELGDDIDLSGYYFNGIPEDFNGTFDGKNHTISGIDIKGDNVAGFFYRLGGTVKDLTLQGKVTVSNGDELSTTARVGGIALFVESSGTIMGCKSLLFITGGLYADKGGVAGKNDGTVNNCLYLGTCSAAGSAHEIDAVGSGNEVTDCTPLYKLEGLDSETLGTVEVSSMVSDGTTYGGCYHEAGSTLTLTLTATEKEGYTISGYHYDEDEYTEVPLTDNVDGTYSLTMPSMDVTIEPTYSYTAIAAMEQDGEGRYLVKTMDDLRIVAQAAIDLNGCLGMTFLLNNDIENAGDFSGIAITPIESSTNYSFYGTFDGGGHTISGLTIVSDARNAGFIGNLDDTYYYEGIAAGTLKNLTLKDCSVTNVYSGGIGHVGMLVGSCQGGKLLNCRVLGGSVMANSERDPESEYYIPSTAGALVGYCILGEDSGNNYYDQKVEVLLDGAPQTPGQCGTGDPDDDLAKALVITLADNDNNSNDIWTFRGVAAEEGDTPDFAGQTFEVTMAGRTLWKDGDWNTLCLPFALSAEQIAASELAGANIRTLASASFDTDDGTLRLNFTPRTGEGAVSSIEAGKPYIVRWTKPTDYVAYNGENAATCSDIVNPVFQNVTLDATDRSVFIDFDTTEGQETGITFCGTYDMKIFDEADPSTILLGGNNTLYYPKPSNGISPSIGALRSYFELTGLTAGEPNSAGGTAGVRAFFLNFDNIETGITSPSKETKSEGVADNWYTIDGRRLNGKPTARGIYINNGKTIVIK